MIGSRAQRFRPGASDIAFVTVAALIAAAVWAVLDRQRANRIEDIFAVQADLQVDLLQTHQEWYVNLFLM